MSGSAPRRLRAAVLGLLTLLALLAGGAVAAPAAVAGPCNQSNCPEPGPGPEPGPHPPPAPVVKHRLTIKKIVCYDINDGFGEVNDEVYLKINGQKVWGTYNISALDGIRYPNVSKDLTGAVNAYLGNVELYDHDTTSGDDRLINLNVYGNGSPTEITGTYDFHMSDSHYSVEIGLQQV